MYGKLVDQNLIVAKAQAIGDGSSSPIDVDSKPDGTTEGMIFVEDPNNAKLFIYANTVITVATAKLLYIELEKYTANTHGSATPPFSDADAHFYPLHKTSADGELAFAAGALIAVIGLDKEFLGSSKYIQLRLQTDDDLSGMKIDAFVYAAH